LFRLSVIEQRSGGYRLSAKRDKTGHADSGFAFAIGLPTAMSWAEQIAADRFAESRREEIIYT
jgi:hypothetical protein